ncbi:hypothetical protein [Leisingera aquaemixtae]|uniref:hypothetical protein n=1 Tax=Leisingera aquaemixtae TaxID=1396826 RepID=UPI0028F6E73D|nr:hypothetical protein [Leisingera aquaemixtae]
MLCCTRFVKGGQCAANPSGQLPRVCFLVRNEIGEIAGFSPAGGHKLAVIAGQVSSTGRAQEDPMPNRQVILTAAMTLACALGIGIYMQYSGAGRGVETAQGLAGGASELPIEPEAAELRIERIALTSAPPDTAIEPKGTPGADPVPAASCQMTATAEAAPQAMVAFSVDAPCRAHERLTVHHSGMSFTASLDSTGQYASLVPALARTAVFIAETASGAGAVAVAEVDGIESMERVVVQWSGNSGFEVHAREFGAAYGSAGHVWHGAAGGSGAGWIDRFGDESHLAARVAEVYSLPSRLPGQSGTVSLTAEAEVTTSNCGRDIFAQALQLRGGRLSSRDLVLAMPDCDAQGSFLVLNNLVEDLKIAAN